MYDGSGAMASPSCANIAAKLAQLAILRDMSAPLPTGGAPSESQTWQELEDVFAALGQLARSSVAPHEFYRTVLDQSVRALSALGGVVWLCARAERCSRSRKRAAPAWMRRTSEDARRAHEALLLEAVAEGRVVSVAPHTVSEEHPDAANPTDQLAACSGQ